MMTTIRSAAAGCLTLFFTCAGLFAADEDVFSLIKKNEANSVKNTVNSKNINIKNKNGDSLLIYAVKNTENPEIIKFLIEAGSNVNDTDKKGYTPLMTAVKEKYNYPGLALSLIKSKADVNAFLNDPYSNEHKNTVLMYACSKTSNDTEVIRALIDNGADVNAVNAEGDSVLIAAVKGENGEFVDLVLQAGAKIEQRDKNGYTPLMIAVKNKYFSPDAAFALIKNKANVNASFNDPYSNEHKTTVLMYACSKGNSPKVIQMLIDKGADVNAVNAKGDSVLITAVKGEKNELVDIVIKAGAKIEQKDKKGYTPLMIAVKDKYSYPGVAFALIKNKADINAFYDDAYSKEYKTTVLMYACSKSNNPKVIQMLADKGADVNAVNAEGDSVLAHAVKGEKGEFAEILIKAGADTEKRDNRGFTPLMAAVKDKYLRQGVAFALIKNKADINAYFDDPLSKEHKNTVLMYASSKAAIDPKVIQMLIDKGAEVNAKNAKGQNALMIAARNAKPETLKILLNAGANIKDTDSYGKTANDYTADNYNLKEKDLDKLK